MLKSDLRDSDLHILWLNHMQMWCGRPGLQKHILGAESLVGIIRNGIFHYVEDS